MTKHEYEARLATANAGHMALAVIEQHGNEMGAVILRGMMMAFVKADAAVSGWSDTMATINNLSRPEATKRPQLMLVK